MITIHNWHKAEGVTYDELAELKLTEVDVHDRQVGLLKKNGTVFAFAAKCPHAGVPLCTGWLDAQGRIVCPEHKYRFDPTNGRNTTGEGYKLFTYQVEVRGSDIFVSLPSLL